MKREHSYITILAILNCLLLWSVFSNYKIVRKEIEKEIIIEKQIDTVVDTKKVVNLEKKVKQLKRKVAILKKENTVLNWENDSMKVQLHEKDGIIGDEEMFPKIIFTEPFSYLMNKP